MFSFLGIAGADLNQEIEKIVRQHHKNKAFHGNVLVRYRGRVIFDKSIGLAQVEWGVKHTSDSKFMIASLSKSFIAAMILILQNQGKLSLEDFVSDYIKLPKNHKIDLKKWNRLKIKDLMGHQGGLERDFRNFSTFNKAVYNLPSANLRAYFKESDIFLNGIDPGENFHYSNLGYLLLAKVIESAGVYFYEDQLIKNRIFAKLHKPTSHCH